MRRVAVVALFALPLSWSTAAEAQVAKEIKGCIGSVTRVITCVVIERGAEKVLDVGFENLIDYIFGKKTDLGPVNPATGQEVSEIGDSLIPWDEFKAFLLTAIGTEPEEDRQELLRKVGEACTAQYSPVCYHFGYRPPSLMPRPAECFRMDQASCEAHQSECLWENASCRHLHAKDVLLP